MSEISLKYRGVLEGFYGQMWSHEERIHLLRHLKEWNMNIYIYSPRDDPYHRFHWDKPYPVREMRQFRELAEIAREQNVMFSYAISPGNTFDPSRKEHRSLLLEKLRPFIEMGCTFFPIFYDDLVDGFEPDSDIGFRHAEMQAEVMNSLTAEICRYCPDAAFLFCPTQYMTAEKSRYLCRLHELLAPNIETAVTGVDPGTDPVCPRFFSDEGAQRYLDNFGRRPFFWDNFNVRDNALTVLHWSPYSGRGCNLQWICSGIVLNPQNIYMLNLPVFGSFGDYLADPENYDSHKSFRTHLVKLMGKDAASLGETLSQWFTSEWFASADSGFVSSVNNLPPLDCQDGMPSLNLLTSIKGALEPLVDFDDRFNRTLMPPEVSACLIPYAHLLSDYARAIVGFCQDFSPDTVVPALERLHNNFAAIERHNYRLPVSLMDYAAELIKCVEVIVDRQKT